MVKEAECAALVPVELAKIKFKKWTKVGHFRPLYIKAHVNRKPINRVLINREAMLNVMAYSMVKKLWKSQKDLKETNMTMYKFTVGSTQALGFLIAELTVGPR